MTDLNASLARRVANDAIAMAKVVHANNVGVDDLDRRKHRAELLQTWRDDFIAGAGALHYAECQSALRVFTVAFSGALEALEGGNDYRCQLSTTDGEFEIGLADAV